MKEIRITTDKGDLWVNLDHWEAQTKWMERKEQEYLAWCWAGKPERQKRLPRKLKKKLKKSK